MRIVQFRSVVLETFDHSVPNVQSDDSTPVVLGDNHPFCQLFVGQGRADKRIAHIGDKSFKQAVCHHNASIGLVKDTTVGIGEKIIDNAHCDPFFPNLRHLQCRRGLCIGIYGRLLAGIVGDNPE